LFFSQFTTYFCKTFLNNLATLLHIDTAGEKAMVAISQNGVLMAIQENEVFQTHASFLQVAIQKLVTETAIPLKSMDAIAVTMGPGSYTGLRVGLSSAKGIAYALNKPMIGLSTLALLANAASKQAWFIEKKEQVQVFAMIDAKRMEVFGALYDSKLNCLLAEQAIVIDSIYLKSLIQKYPTLCIGSAATKAKTLVEDPAIVFVEQSYNVLDCIQLAEAAFSKSKFEDIAYSSPSYLKEFFFKK
jgi:tRNA threonylcarbamoyladenosine biosynthesis protein TsaB